MPELVMPVLFTLEEIRAAFWKVFHQSGELWFPYPLGTTIFERGGLKYTERLEDPTVGQDATEAKWKEFVDSLGEDHA